MNASLVLPIDSNRGSERGSAMVIGVIVIFIIAAVASVFVSSGVADSRHRQSSIHRTKVLYVAEAGVKNAISELNTGGDGVIGTKDAQVSFGGGTYYTTATSLGGDCYSVVSVGRIGDERRAVEIILAPVSNSLFKKAMFGDLDLGATGNVFVDSYDSELGTYATQAVNSHGPTGETYAKANGTLGSNRNIRLTGSVTVLGDAQPGPGYGVSTTGSVYVEGSTAPRDAPEPLAPINYEPPIGSSGNLTYTGTSSVSWGAGTYRYNKLTMTGQSTLTINGDVILYIDGNLSLTGGSKLILADGASLTIHHNGSNFALTGSGVLNTSQKPEKLKVYTQASNVSFTGNSGFYGAIYAPNGNIRPTGTSDLFGSIIGRTITITGSAEFHYDEDLARSNDSTTRLRIASWRRLDAFEE